MAKARIVFGVWLIIWSLVLFVGSRLYLGVVAQQVVGYPRPGQFYLYILFPCALLTSNILLVVFSRKLHWPILTVAFVIQFVAFLAFFFYGSGGV
ncbi:hypothetical protein DDE05_50575 [Streptomyces cavourensis]|nr:hypothetical protein DDE05_50575 [Streptomyces cavourensis]